MHCLHFTLNVVKRCRRGCDWRTPPTGCDGQWPPTWPFKGPSREHSESDLRCYLSWCAERGLDPLAAQRPHLELYIRWMHQAGADWNRYAADIARSRDHQP